jgi:hypothetical protein
MVGRRALACTERSAVEACLQASGFQPGCPLCRSAPARDRSIQSFVGACVQRTRFNEGACCRSLRAGDRLFLKPFALSVACKASGVEASSGIPFDSGASRLRSGRTEVPQYASPAAVIARSS